MGRAAPSQVSHGPPFIYFLRSIMAAARGGILVFAKSTDMHIGLVQAHITSPLTVINTGSITDGLTYKTSDDGTRLDVFYGTERIETTPNSFKSVWYRRTKVADLLPAEVVIEPPEHRTYALSSMQNHANAMFGLVAQDAFWVSCRKALQDAEQKPQQLILAAKIGFNVPETLFTASAEHAKAFVKQHGACVVKTLTKDMITLHSQYAVVRSASEIRFDGLIINPHIFQAMIVPKKEVRVAVIGTKVFADEVKDVGDQEMADEHSVRDWRHGYETATLVTTPTELPKRLEELCVEIVRKLKIVCGYIDLMQDQDGKWWFIEINPNGQWGFMHPQTSNHIARALGHLLETARSPW
jgi:glutathione synthase/RimK-type ligase-like ATP-grasp enzyme